MFDVLAPHGNLSYWKTGFVNSVSPAVARTMVEFGRAAPSPLSQAEFMMPGYQIKIRPSAIVLVGLSTTWWQTGPMRRRTARILPGREISSTPCSPSRPVRPMPIISATVTIELVMPLAQTMID